MNNTPTPTPITDERKASFALDTIRQLETKLATVTEQRDEALSDLEFRRDLYSLQTKQLDDVREQWYRLEEEADKWEQIAHDKLSEVCRQIEKTRVVTEQLTVAREELNTAREDQAYMHKDLTIAIEQRDRLAEALLELRNNNSLSLGGAAYEIVEQALQSLNQND